MKAGTLRTTDTAFMSLESFTPVSFKRWVDNRPMHDINRYELASSGIIKIPPAAWEHGEIEAKLIQILGAFITENRLGKLFGSSAGYQLPSSDILEPDASFLTTTRWAKGPQPKRGQFLKLVPNLAVEILSPTTARRDAPIRKTSIKSTA